MISTLENLPNELLLFILKYLSVIDFLYSFYRLNRRFSSLIRTIQHLHVDFSSQSLGQTQFIHIINQLRSLNIESLRISTRYYIDAIPLLTAYLPPSQLTHLRALALIDVDRNTIEKFLHNYPRLTTLSIKSSLWRSIPRRLLPHFSNLTYCHIPTLDFLHDRHLKIVHLTVDHCTADHLLQFNTLVPHLHSLTLTLHHSTNIPATLDLPTNLASLKLILRSVLFNEFQRLMMMIGHVKNLTVSFSNTEHEVHCFDQYLSGEQWYTIHQYVENLHFNIILHQTLEMFITSELISNFDWFDQRVLCHTMDDTNGYHLYSLPFIDKIYTINSIRDQDDLIHRNDFDRVHHLHLTIPNKEDIQYSFNISSNYIYRNLQTLTVVAPSIDQSLMSYINTLMINSRLRTFELRLTSTTNNCRNFFDKLIEYLPSSIEILILNTVSTRFLSELLDNNNQLLLHIKRLLCAVKNRDQFDTLILLLLEIFHKKSLVYLSISLENPNKSSNFLSGWLLKTTYLKKARIKCSDRQCAIWI